MMNDDRLGGTDPFACVVELSIEANGADDGAGIDFHGRGLFEERLEGEANRLAAASEYPCRVDVTVDGGVVRDAVVFGDVVGTVPAEKFVLDSFAVGMLANAAFTRMARKGLS